MLIHPSEIKEDYRDKGIIVLTNDADVYLASYFDEYNDFPRPFGALISVLIALRKQKLFRDLVPLLDPAASFILNFQKIQEFFWENGYHEYKLFITENLS